MSPAATSLNRGFVFLTGHKDSFVLFDTNQLEGSGGACLLVFMRIHECQWSLPDAIIKIFVRTFIISRPAACAHPGPSPGVTWSQWHFVIFLDFNTSTKSWCRNSFNIPSPPISWPFSLGQFNVRFSSQKCFIVKYEMSSSLSKTCHMILKFAFKY